MGSQLPRGSGPPTHPHLVIQAEMHSLVEILEKNNVLSPALTLGGGVGQSVQRLIRSEGLYI